MVLSFSARVQVKKEARARLNTRMRSAACTFKKKRKAHKKGRDKYHQSNVYTCSVDLKDMATAIDLRKEVELLKEELVVVQEEMKSIHYKHDEVVTLYNAMTTLTGTVDDGTLLDQLGRDNQELRQYISEEKRQNTHNGKPHHMVGERQQQRNMRKIRSAAEAALCFVESYGMQLKTVTTTDAQGKTHELAYGRGSFHTAYEKMQDEDKETVEKVLFILEKFCGSDQMYNDLVQVLNTNGNGMPKLYQVVQCRNQLNEPILEEISATPGPHPGSQRSLTKCLQREAANIKGNTLKVRVSVDGAKVSRKSNFIVMSYATLDGEGSELSAAHNKVVGIVNAPEEFLNLKECFKDLFTEVSDIQESGSVSTSNGNVPTEIFLGGDMKFISMVLGLSAATANHACPWCKVHKNHRHDTTNSPAYFNTPPVARTMDELRTQNPTQVKDNTVTDGKTGKNKYGQKHEPLINVELDHIVIDELHMMLRITDILTNALVKNAMQKDKLEGHKKVLEAPNLLNVIKAANACGVSFNVWEEKNADGAASGHYTFTSLMGTDKVKLLSGITAHLDGCLMTDTQAAVLTTWTEFFEIYQTVNDRSLEEDQITQLEDKVKGWVKVFCDLGNSVPGYGKAKVTPYIHVLMMHVPYLLRRYGNLQQFSGQGVEKLNDVARRVHHRRSNKHKATQDVLLATARIDTLATRGRERSRRGYSRKE